MNSWIKDQGYQDFPVLLPSFETDLILTTIENKSSNNVNYSSLSNIWKAPNQPASRYLHSAVWTGSEMIIWGGTNRFDSFRTYYPYVEGIYFNGFD